MKKIEIFYSKMCWACHEAMDYFSEHNLAYDSFEVSWQGEELIDSQNARDLISRLGPVEFVPQIFIGGKHIGGWARLEELIEKDGLTELLKD